jgi:outer membrane lipoprotein-sorting protein
LRDDENNNGSIKIIMIAALVVLFIVIALIVTKLMLANTNKVIIEQMKFRNEKIESIKVTNHQDVEYAPVKTLSNRKDVDSVE